MIVGEGNFRSRLLLLVERFPGLHMRGLQRRAQCSAMLAEYHLNILEKEGLVTSQTESGYRTFFPARGPPLQLDATDRKWLALLRRPPILALALMLLDESPQRPNALAASLAVSASTLNYQLNQAQQIGLVQRRRLAGQTEVYLADPQRVQDLLRSFHPTPDVVTSYGALWSQVLQRPAPEAEPTTATPSDDDLPEPVQRMPPATRTVYRVLLDGPMTGKDLVAETGLSRRTIYVGIKRLRAAGLLGEQGNLRDMRQSMFWVKGELGPAGQEPDEAP